ncbi:YibE/F family protein, partial [Enterococcus faecalis]
ICSSTYEIYTKNPDLTFKELFNSSFNVVIEVLNSTIYTLLFAFIASNFALVIYLQDLNYSFLELINSKIFVGELLVSILTGCAGILILPLSCLLGSWILKKRFHTLY